jgi:hypothetical protein
MRPPALAAVLCAGVQNLYVMDLPGEHTLRMDGSIMGKGHKARDGVCVLRCMHSCVRVPV